MGGTETKPSLQTSEFWIHAAIQLFLLLNTVNVYQYLPDKWSGILQAVVASVYMFSRGLAKAGTAPTPNQNANSDPATFPSE